MPENPEVTLEEFRDAARTWLSGRNLPRLVGSSEVDLPTVRAWQAELLAAGFAGITWPVEYGGRGLSFAHQSVFNEELARAGGPIPSGQPGIDVVGPTLIRYASPAQRERYLPGLLSGADLWCLGLSEPESGSDLASVRTTALRDGEEFVVDGQKIWTSYGPTATHCLLLARTDPAAAKHQGLSFFLLPMDTPGLTVRPITDLSGDQHFSEVFLDGVRLPETALLGDLHAGWSYARVSLGLERGPMMSRRLAELSVAFDHLAQELAGQELTPGEYAGWGRIRSRLDALRGQQTRMFERMQAGSASAVDSADKVFFARVDQEMFELVVRMVGATRTLSDSRPRGIDVQRWMRRYFYSRMGSIYGGTDQVQLTIIAKQILELPA